MCSVQEAHEQREAVEKAQTDAQATEAAGRGPSHREGTGGGGHQAGGGG